MDGARPREELLAARVERLAAAADLPSFAHQIEELVLATRDTRTSVWQLADAILKNVSLTAKVLRRVNSAYFNRTGQPILSVSHAVRLLGLDTIRDLAASMLLFEHFRNGPSGVRELVLLALLTANHAREVAVQTGYPRPEEAYLCGMFRGLGELLVAHCQPAEYAKILEQMRANAWSPHQASLHVLSFSYDELARAMMRRWGFGEKVAGAIQRPELVNPTPANDVDRLGLIVAFSQALTMAVYRLDPAEGRQRLRALLKRWGAGLSMSEDRVGQVLKEALDETKETFAASGTALDSLRLVQQIESVVSGTDQDARPAAEIRSDEGPARVTGADVLARLAGEVEAVVTSSAPFQLNDVITLILEAIYRGTGCDRVLFCLMESDRAQLSARMGVGAGATALIKRFQFPVSLLGSPVGIAVLRKSDVFVESVRASPYRTSSFASVVQAAAFGLVPLIVNGTAIGCFYFDRLLGPLALDGQTRQTILALRDRASQAIARRV